MIGHQRYLSPSRSAASLADARALRADIATALTAAPRDERALRQLVWAYVGTERRARASPESVILTLTQLLERAPVEADERKPLLRRVILWCVEAYFGHLRGDVFRESFPDATVTSAASTS